MPAKQRLADVQCTRLKFNPGDRVMVKVFTTLDKDTLRKLRKTVQKWAGEDVEVLIVNCLKYDVQIEQTGKNNGQG